ncbi:MAG: peroxiredoxin family protein [Tangfeifania sp.]
MPAIATVIIKGTNHDYAGKELKFFRYTDPVTKGKIQAFILKPDDEGHFSVEVEVSEPTFVFSEFGIYRGLLFLEPKKNIQLLLPPWREKSFADQKNPFFQPVEFWFATQQGDCLNDRIAAFDTKLNQLTDKYFNQLYFSQSKAYYDTIKTLINKEFEEIDSPVFNSHKTLKLQAVRADAFRLNPAAFSEVFMTTDPQFHTHRAFMELFDKTFDNRLSFEIKKVDNARLIEAVDRMNISFLLQFTEENYGLKSPVTELALLKMLHDGFYSGDFPKKAIVGILSSGKLQNNSNPKIAAVAKNVKDKLDFMLPGSQAPVICLKNTDGNKTCTDRNNDKFKYFVFADTEMVVCQEQLKYLSKIEEKFSDHLEIYVILRKTDPTEMKMFLNGQNISGVHLVDENGEYIERYRIKSFPVCVLLNENHEVVYSPAQAPLDGFEQQFGKYLQRKLFEKQRNQGR